MWCMELKVCMGDEHHRYYKHTKFHQNPRDDPKFLVDLTRNDTYIVYVHCHTYFDNMVTTDVPYSPTKLCYKNIYKFKCRGKNGILFTKLLL